MKTPQERIAQLEHENQMLKMKVEILELSIEIEKRKLERERVKSPYSPWSPTVTWTSGSVKPGWTTGSGTWTTNISTSTASAVDDIKSMLDSLNRRYRKGTNGPGTPAVS